MKIPIIFEPNYKIGDTVYLRINPERKMVVDGYRIYNINNDGEVIGFVYSVYDGGGVSFTFTDIDLALSERVS